MKAVLLLLVFVLFFESVKAQEAKIRDSSFVLILNQQIDQYVIEKNTAALEKLYSEDFVFSHGTGFIEGKRSWLIAVQENNYTIRKHDSVTIEMHRKIAIARGKLTVQRSSKDKGSNYWLRYIRVYICKHQHWQMISHITTFEHDD